MSNICSPESATASLTAVNAWAASGMSAERVTFEKPTPLTATLHRFSHISVILLGTRILVNAKDAMGTQRTRSRFFARAQRAKGIFTTGTRRAQRIGFARNLCALCD